MRWLSLVLMAAVIGGCADDRSASSPTALHPELANVATTPPQYTVARLPTLFGRSQGGGINNDGVVAGFSGLPDGTRHAALWVNGAITDLGSLGGSQPGLHSNPQWPGINSSGLVVGISHTPALDTLGETWSCAAFMAANGHVCLGFQWQGGIMTALNHLGGENSFAAGVNAKSQVVGWAETAVHDPTCNAPQVLQFRAVMWSAGGSQVQQLGPLPGDSTSAATAINNRGQVVGISGECDVAVGRRSATHAVLWDNGTVTDIGNLGGNFWHTPMAINDRGDVVGFSNPPDGDIDADSVRAFAWTRSGGIKDLGKLAGDAFSQALGINSRGQVVGVSCADLCQAILWQDGKMYKLKDLVPGFGDLLWSARSINDAGQITGRMIDAGTGKWYAYVATPVTQ